MCNRCFNSFSCFVSPDVVDELLKSADPAIRDAALETTKLSAEARTMRFMTQMMPQLSAIPSPSNSKYRLVYDMREVGNMLALPGTLVREEGGSESTDAAVNEAYEFAGVTYDCYKEVFGRNSLDDNGMQLISSVHFGRRFQNGFWNGFQMAYGDGDGQIFLRFTKSLDVVAHELTHGVITHSSNLVYQDEPGALNESFADVMSAIVVQWDRKQSVDEADWLMGNELMGPALGGTARAFRVFDEGKAYENHPVLGTDRQPKHIRDKYTGTQDNGGVHINSGIPNHAFYRVAKKLGGNSWEAAGQIWYETLLSLRSTSDFRHCAETCLQVARKNYGTGSAEEQAVIEGWQAVGLLQAGV
ncbi:MAG: M4 family metallopeptidase [Rhizobiaceae bacterium]